MLMRNNVLCSQCFLFTCSSHHSAQLSWAKHLLTSVSRLHLFLSTQLNEPPGAHWAFIRAFKPSRRTTKPWRKHIDTWPHCTPSASSSPGPLQHHKYVLDWLTVKEKREDMQSDRDRKRQSSSMHICNTLLNHQSHTQTCCWMAWNIKI